MRRQDAITTTHVENATGSLRDRLNEQRMVMDIRMPKVRGCHGIRQYFFSAIIGLFRRTKVYNQAPAWEKASRKRGAIEGPEDSELPSNAAKC